MIYFFKKPGIKSRLTSLEGFVELDTSTKLSSFASLKKDACATTFYRTTPDRQTLELLVIPSEFVTFTNDKKSIDQLNPAHCFLKKIELPYLLYSYHPPKNNKIKKDSK